MVNVSAAFICLSHLKQTKALRTDQTSRCIHRFFSRITHLPQKNKEQGDLGKEAPHTRSTFSSILRDSPDRFCPILHAMNGKGGKQISEHIRTEEKPMPVIHQTGNTIDHYLNVKLLGQGSDSTVYLARDEQDQQEVMLKFPHIEEMGSTDVSALYQREVAIGKRLSDHPGLQHQFYPDEAHSKASIVLHYLRRHSLKEKLNALTPELLPVDEALRIVLSVVCGFGKSRLVLGGILSNLSTDLHHLMR